MILIHPETINNTTVAIAEPVRIGDVPVVMVVTKDNKLIAACNPDNLTIQDVRAYLLIGCIIRQTTYKQLMESSIEWLCDKKEVRL